MSDAGESTREAPEGATSVTAKDVLAQAAPERYEDVELWVVTAFGKAETIMIRPSIGESGKLQQSPLDGSFLGLLFEFHAGDEANKLTGRQFFSLGPGISYKLAYHSMPVYKHGESPAEVEMKRRDKLKADRIATLAAQRDEHLDDQD